MIDPEVNHICDLLAFNFVERHSLNSKLAEHLAQCSEEEMTEVAKRLIDRVGHLISRSHYTVADVMQW